MRWLQEELVSWLILQTEIKTTEISKRSDHQPRKCRFAVDGGLIVTIRFRIPLEREEAMKAGPICPLRLGTLDSLDYWTDPVLMSSVRPLSAQEIHLAAEQSRLSQVRCRPQRRKS